MTNRIGIRPMLLPRRLALTDGTARDQSRTATHQHQDDHSGSAHDRNLTE
jgi:hypothetical protein